MHKKLVIVADGARAQLLSAKGRKLHNLIQTFENHSLDSHDTQVRKSCRTSDGHFYDPHCSTRDLEKQSFAKDLTKEVNQRMLRGNFGSIILVASPQMLGMLRKTLNSHHAIEKSLCLEATRMNIEQLEDRIFS